MSSSARTGLLLVAVTLAGIAGLVWLAAPAPVPPPPPPARDWERDFADATEDAVEAVEEMLADLARQLERRAWGGALHHLADDYRGGGLVWKADGPERAVGGVRILSGGADPRDLDRAGFRAALEDLNLSRVVFKVPEAKLDGGTLRGRLVLDGVEEPVSLRRRRVARFDVEFASRHGRWRIRSLRGTGLRVEEAELRFRDATERLGLTVPPGADDRDTSSLTFGRLFIGGIAAADFDGDGRTDLFVPRVGPDLLLRNEGGRFVDRARELGIADEETGAAALFLDIDNDGDLDLLVTNYEPARLWERDGTSFRENPRRALSLYRNEGGRYIDVTERAGLKTRGPAMSAAAADVNQDGHLDFYVCYYRDDAEEDPRFSEEIPARVWDARNGVPNQLWINRGDGTFREEGAARGVADTGWSLAAAFCDYDEDGRIDLYVANDYGENRLFRNLGDGKFEDATVRSGTTDRAFGMGATWLDYDGDGRLDLYVSNMYSTAGNRILSRGAGSLGADQHSQLLRMAAGNTLFRNRGDGTFEERAGAGAKKAGWAWSSAAFDYDNDGRPDLYVSNGFRTSPYSNADT